MQSGEAPHSLVIRADGKSVEQRWSCTDSFNGASLPIHMPQSPLSLSPVIILFMKLEGLVDAYPSCGVGRSQGRIS